MQIKGGSWNWYFQEQFQQAGSLQAKHLKGAEAALTKELRLL